MRISDWSSDVCSSDLMEWVSAQDGVPSIDANRLFGRHAWSADVPAPDKRDMWADDQVVSLFGTAIWTGCEPHPRKRYWRWEPGGRIIRDEYFWLPLLAIYNGARLEENAQLLGSDIDRTRPRLNSSHY